MEHEVGSLTPGKRADLVVLENDLFEVGQYDIGRIDVALTMMDGRVTHVGEDFGVRTGVQAS